MSLKEVDGNQKKSQSLALDPAACSHRHRDGYLFLMATMLVVSFFLSGPGFTDLGHALAEVVQVSAAKKKHYTELKIDASGNQLTLLAHGLSLEETEKVRSLSPGTKLEI